MRNRPDSRHRLAGLRATAQWAGPASPPLASVTYHNRVDDDHDDVGDLSRPGGWVPDFDEPDADGDSFGVDQTAPRRARGRHSARRRWGRLAGRWAPESLRGSRVDPGRKGAVLLTLVAAVAALVAAFGVWRDRPEPRPVTPVALSQASGAPTSVSRLTAVRSSGSSPSRSGAAVVTTAGGASGVIAASGVIVVSVTGAVRRPGLVRLAAGARVADAIDRAGGATTQADLTGLNLAQHLADGASVVVADRGSGASGSLGAGSAGSGSARGGSAGGGSSVSGGGDATGSAAAVSGAPAGKVDLNTADVAALDALPGVGPVTAAGIVAWRQKNGRFSSVEQLQEIPGIGPAKYKVLSGLVIV